MTSAACFRLLTFLVLALVGLGCGEVTPNTTTILPTPSEVLQPKPPEAASSEAAKPDAAESPHPTTTDQHAAEPGAIKPIDLAALPADTDASAPAVRVAEPSITLIPVKFDEFRARITANPTKAKFTLVDAWATYCPPCKENFPHLVEMHHKYGDRGLRVISVSLDDPSVPEDIQEAEKFLHEKKAVITNFLIDEEAGVAFDKFDINAIPAVFLYGPDGKEIKRFTLDDPDNQFTYEQVEKVVRDLLDGKPLPKEPN